MTAPRSDRLGADRRRGCGVGRGPVSRYLLPDGRQALPVALANGVKEAAFYARCRNGWPVEMACGLVPKARTSNAGRPALLLLADGRSARAVARENGIGAKAFDSRLNRGLTLEQAAGVDPMPDGPRRSARSRRLLPDGRSAVQVAEANGINRGTFQSRCRIGWTPAEAAGVVPRKAAS